MTNRLAASTSPYLLQHKENPVDWWEWGSDAFAEAERRDVPVLLSIGYSACHWCHVMAHESFEDEQIAATMNAGFICIKVDREERPDVDSIYMEAVQRLTGSGGWPLTAFLDHDAAPFYAGTYFPPEPRHGMPSFPQVLEAISEAWADNREEVAKTAKQVVELLATPMTVGEKPLTAAELDAAFASLRGSYDPQRGGFGGAPKFPPSMCLEFLLRHHARTGNGLNMVDRTCERMARGGMYDQLAGGFARYSVDADWVVPHFEKMLYDNALLLRVYTHLWRETGSPLAERIVRETAQWMISELQTSEGGFASALDADSLDASGHSHEGAYYVWTPTQLVEVLGEDDGAWAATLLNVTATGTFEHGSSVLQLLVDPDDFERWQQVRHSLLEARKVRTPPARDDKIVAAWNGLAIAALADVGVQFYDQSLVDAAIRAADVLRLTHWIDKRLRRVSRDGVVGQPAGVLEDYSNVAEGLMALHQATLDPRSLGWAGELLDVVLEHFSDGAGSFYDTADDAEELVIRPRDETDNATPSGQSAAANALLTYAALTGSQKHRDAAEAALARSSHLVEKVARFAGWAAAAGEANVAGPLEIAVVDSPELAAVARRATSPGAVVVAGPPNGSSPLLADRLVPAAYVCQGFVCDAPINDAAALATRVRARG